MSRKKITRRVFVSSVVMAAGTVALGKAFPTHDILRPEVNADPLQKVSLERAVSKRHFWEWEQGSMAIIGLQQ